MWLKFPSTLKIRVCGTLIKHASNCLCKWDEEFIQIFLKHKTIHRVGQNWSHFWPCKNILNAFKIVKKYLNVYLRSKEIAYVQLFFVHADKY